MHGVSHTSVDSTHTDPNIQGGGEVCVCAATYAKQPPHTHLYQASQRLPPAAVVQGLNMGNLFQIRVVRLEHV